MTARESQRQRRRLREKEREPEHKRITTYTRVCVCVCVCLAIGCLSSGSGSSSSGYGCGLCFLAQRQTNARKGSPLKSVRGCVCVCGGVRVFLRRVSGVHWTGYNTLEQELACIACQLSPHTQDATLI